MNEQLIRKRKVSKWGIFYIYNWKVFAKTFPFLFSLVIGLMYFFIGTNSKSDPFRLYSYLTEKIDSLFPNLIGFSLGGYAIIVSFGNVDFLRKIAKSGSPYYESLNAIFGFSILIQVLVLFISLISGIVSELQHELIFNFAESICNKGNIIFNTFLIFFSSWSLLLIPYVVTNVFILGQTHHELLKYTNEEEAKPPVIRIKSYTRIIRSYLIRKQRKVNK